MKKRYKTKKEKTIVEPSFDLLEKEAIKDEILEKEKLENEKIEKDEIEKRKLVLKCIKAKIKLIIFSLIFLPLIVGGIITAFFNPGVALIVTTYSLIIYFPILYYLLDVCKQCRKRIGVDNKEFKIMVKSCKAQKTNKTDLKLDRIEENMINSQE